MLSPIEREKVITTIQSRFSASNQWAELRSRHAESFNTTGICINAALSLACIPAFVWFVHMALFAPEVSIAAGGWCFLGSFFVIPAFIVTGFHAVTATMERRSIVKLFKQSTTREHLRELFQKKRNKKYLEEILPKMSDQDIELLEKYPHIQFGQKLISGEKNRREKANQEQKAKEIENTFIGVQTRPEPVEDVVCVQPPRSLNL